MATAEITKLKQMLRDKALPLDAQIAIEQRRGALEKVPFRVAEDIAVEPVTATGRPAEWLRAPGADLTQMLLYLHGGGYVMGSINTHRSLAGELARTVHSYLGDRDRHQILRFRVSRQ